MVDKYRRLLLVEAERASPSSEIVMIDRTFNQEERSALTQDKRTVLLDPDGFLDDFCCGVRSSLFSPPPPPPPLSPPSGPTSYFSDSPASPCSSGSALRTDPVQPPYSDPGGGGGGGGAGGEPHRPHKNELKLKFHTSAFAAGRYVSATHSDTDSALEAAVNSILEC
ncbi:unnamed protein product [Knipowitschia caucasica]|uniref:GLTSCR protein conserved domain-containing protein n=1 Tax=Knipowitschia caucasica TaxID=637954 RepID=A0AAV2LEN1_KNICA